MSRSKWLISRILKYTGVQAAFETVSPGGINILTVHRVLPSEWSTFVPWERQSISPTTLRILLEILSGYRIMGLREAVNLLQEKSGLKSGHAPITVITFDDGLIDFYRFAFPVLRELNIPATLFLSTGPVEKKGSLWWEEIALRVWSAPEEVSKIPLITGRHDVLRRKIDEFALSRDAEAWREGQRYIRKLFPGERHALHKAIVEGVPGGRGSDGIDMISVEMVREISSAGISIQAHTVTHGYLDQMTGAELERELVEGKEKIGSWTGKEVDFLAYPAGRLPGTEGMKIVRKLYRAALTTRPGRNGAGEDPHCLKRKDVHYLLSDGRVDRETVRMELGGLVDLIWKRPE